MKKLRLSRFFVMALMINSMSMYGMLVRTQQAQRAATQRAAVQRGAYSNQSLPSRQYSVKPIEQKPASESAGGWFSNWWSSPSQSQESIHVEKPSWFSELWYGKKMEPVQVGADVESVAEPVIKNVTYQPSGDQLTEAKRLQKLEQAKQRRKELSGAKKQKKELEQELVELKTELNNEREWVLAGVGVPSMINFYHWDANISKRQEKLARINAKLSQTGRQKSLSPWEIRGLKERADSLLIRLKMEESKKRGSKRSNFSEVFLNYDSYNDPINNLQNELAIVEEKLSRAKVSERRQLERE